MSDLYIDVERYTINKTKIHNKLSIGLDINPQLINFKEWADENDIYYWVDNLENSNIIRIYFDDEADYMAAKVGWF